MRAVQLFKAGRIQNHPLVLVEQQIPQPGPGQVRIRVRVCGACHTDLHIAEGDITPPILPITPGHQVVGVVDALGPEVTSPNIGARVGVPWFFDACGTCEFCLREEENLCREARFTGFHMPGGFADYMLAEAKYVLPIPVDIPDQQAAPLLCAGIIGFRSLHKAEVHPGERVGLFGFGASAHLAIQVARYWDCQVYVFTRSHKHREHALHLGAAWVGGAADSAPDLLDRAIIFAPSGAIVHHALRKLRPGGTLAINAIHMSPIPEIPYDLIYGERTLRSVANATYRDGTDFLKLAAEIPIQPTVTVYDLEQANQALCDIKDSRINGEAVLLISQGSMV